MSIINITVEGQTEQAFCNKVLNDYVFLRSGHQIMATPVFTNKRLSIKGGNVSWYKLMPHIVTWMKSTPNQYHTMMFDLYALKTDLPGYNELLRGVAKAEAIENAIKSAINSPLFIPYIQVHEFEALLFSKPETLNEWLGLYENRPLSFEDELIGLSTPEEINEGSETAPSKRIISATTRYKKVDDGIIIAEEIGVEAMRERCPHFNEWIETLLCLK